MKSDDLLAIVDFLYCGEANVFQENLDSFLAFAEELELKSLTGKQDEKFKDCKVEEKSQPPPLLLPAFKTSTNIPKSSVKREPSINTIHRAEVDGTLAIPASFQGDLDELEERVKSMMEKSQNKTANGSRLAHMCKVCGKEGKGRDIKDHIEANHLEGIMIPCNLCDKTFRSRNSFGQNKKKTPQQIDSDTFYPQR